MPERRGRVRSARRRGAVARRSDRQRIVQLGGAPDFSPASLAARSNTEYVEGRDLRDMIREDLVAERIAVGSYGETIRCMGNDDSTTRIMLEGILANEESMRDLSSMLDSSLLETKDP